MSLYGWDPANDDGLYRERAIRARSENMSMSEVLDFIAGNTDAQEELEDRLQSVRNQPSIENCFRLSVFLDQQAEARAKRRVRA